MRALISPALMVLCAFSLNAQVTAVLKKVSDRSPMTGAVMERPEIEIRNDSIDSLTALAINLAPTSEGAADVSPFLVYFDSAIDAYRSPGGCQMPLPPNQACTVSMPTIFSATGQSRDLFRPPIITAALFADGSTTGDATLTARLMLRRGSLLQAVELTRDILADAGGRNVSRSDLVEEFRMLADSANHWYLPPRGPSIPRALPIYRRETDEFATIAGRITVPANCVRRTGGSNIESRARGANEFKTKLGRDLSPGSNVRAADKFSLVPALIKVIVRTPANRST